MNKHEIFQKGRHQTIHFVNLVRLDWVCIKTIYEQTIQEIIEIAHYLQSEKHLVLKIKKISETEEDVN